MSATFEIPLSKDDRSAHFVYILLQKKQDLGRTFEKNFRVTFGASEGGKLTFTTDPGNERNVRNGFNIVLKQFSAGKHLTKEMISEAAANVFTGAESSNDNSASANFGAAARRSHGGQNNAQHGQGTAYHFKARTERQQRLAEQIRDPDNFLVFGEGPAGTGKTHVAVAMAVEALNRGDIKKIFLARPAVGTGKDLGAMPGDLRAKLAPFMQPLYDELAEVMGPKRLNDLMETGVIEIAAVEMIQGRTLKNAYIIFDEAQNMTIDQVKLALTRQGDNSKVIVTGSVDQIILPNKDDCGMAFALDRLEGVEGVAIQHFDKSDVVRHVMVQRVIEAFEKAPQKQPVNKPAGPGARG